jgi:hypothetical protein
MRNNIEERRHKQGLLAGILLAAGGMLFLLTLTQPSTFGIYSTTSWGRPLEILAALVVALGFALLAWVSARKNAPRNALWSIALVVIGMERLVALMLVVAPVRSFVALVVLQLLVFLAGLYALAQLPKQSHAAVVRWLFAAVIVLLIVSFAVQYLFAAGPLVTAFILQVLLPIAFIALGTGLLLEHRWAITRASREG